MTDSHFAIAVGAFTEAMGTRLRQGIYTFPDLFTEDGVIEVPFDGDGTAAPIKGRPAIVSMVEALNGMLAFEEVVITDVHDVDAATVVCEYRARLLRADLQGRFTRRYVSIMTLRDGRIAYLREYGGPLLPVPL